MAHAQHFAHLLNVFAPLIQSQIFPFIKGSLFFIFMHSSIQRLAVSWAQLHHLLSTQRPISSTFYTVKEMWQWYTCQTQFTQV